MRLYAAAVALLGWFALALQLYVSITVALATGIPVVVAVLNYFSFFTVLTNLLVALTLTFSVLRPERGWGRFFSRATVKAAVAVYIAIVGITYSLLLRHTWDPEGLQKVADIILHDAIPLLYLLYWIFFVSKRGLRAGDVFGWTVYPVAYFAYALGRGAVTGRYPYPFIDVTALGYPRVLANAAMLMAGFVVMSLLAVAVGRVLPGPPEAS